MSDTIKSIEPKKVEPQLMTVSIITMDFRQQLLDLIRDVPMPRKVTDPIFNQLVNAPTAEIDVNQMQKK